MSNTTKPARPRRKAVYHVRNWSAYDRALVRRGALTLWVDADVQKQWAYAGPPQRGAQPTYSDVAIETMLTVKEVFHLPNRAAEGLVRSILPLNPTLCPGGEWYQSASRILNPCQPLRRYASPVLTQGSRS